jgi:hypothetical protein
MLVFGMVFVWRPDLDRDGIVLPSGAEADDPLAVRETALPTCPKLVAIFCGFPAGISSR